MAGPRPATNEGGTEACDENTVVLRLNSASIGLSPAVVAGLGPAIHETRLRLARAREPENTLEIEAGRCYICGMTESRRGMLRITGPILG